MFRRLAFILVLTMVSGTSKSVSAQYCPGAIAGLEGSELSSDGALILAEIYKKLGCTLTVKYLPGRRAVRHFNESLVDGEMFRHSIIEKKYSRAFVRSSVPITNMVNALWVHPSSEVNKPVGIILGVAWQENFVPDTATGKRVKHSRFHTDLQVVEAYNRGYISGFLATEQWVDTLRRENRLNPMPVLKKTILSIPIYHYVGVDFSAFMADFSNELKLNAPFLNVR